MAPPAADATQAGAGIGVHDGLYEAAFIRDVQDILIHRGWTYTEGARHGAELVHWVTELSAEDTWVGALLAPIRPLVGAAGSFRLARAYCNAHVSSDVPLPHVDSRSAGDRTVLIYANADWRPEFAGETVFFDDRDEITRAVIPRPGRAVIFDSAIRHCARPPTKIFLGLRLTVAFKFVAL